MLTHTELNISSMTGFAMIVGAAAETGVLYSSSLAAVLALALAPLALGIISGLSVQVPIVLIVFPSHASSCARNTP